VRNWDEITSPFLTHNNKTTKTTNRLYIMDMSSLMQQAQQIQTKMATIQEELKSKTATGTAGGGMVTVTANGKSEILSIEIENFS